MRADLYWIPGPWRGRLAVVSRPRGGDWLVDEVSSWRQAGLDLVVSLLENDEAAQLGLDREGAVTQAGSLEFISFPIADRGVPISTRDTLSFLGDLAIALEHGKNVAVHCRQGIGRSGLVAAALLIRSGIEVDKAIEAVSAARGLKIPETPVQVQWIKQLPSELPVSAS